ncbi:ribonuclease HII [Arthrobacter sp. 260]|uniref:ribonuclease HII n=1 Tax=Arthrobacter sp. 260 TaxID=2735314 RepID=UPI001492F104|nr:ribonuclease HII [Arthrobacter sp. 260]NOJ60337.1 ribonuclease HII [Arthrobacter sp. 260]
MKSVAPTLRYERSFREAGHRYLAGCDEVGRGALAGPVSVGLVLIDLDEIKGLRGVRDSKLLSPADRVKLVPRIQKWALAYGVGHASAAEIDAVGLMSALQRAGNRAWEQVVATARPDAVILDGNHDWLSPRQQATLFDGETDVLAAGCDVPVHTRIKGDLSCLSVAAASVLAKVERDAMMVSYAADHPQYGWDINKGYATAGHRAAIDGLGPTGLHRTTWRLGTGDGMNIPRVENGG